IYQGVEDKATVLRQVARKYGFTLGQVAYVGDDCNDLEVMEAAGLVFAPADAAKEVLEYADIVVTSRGGEGAVREVADYLLKGQS
ncbi:HAD hydrolase family protein, partial [Salmonella enterica]|uniref:HAD hydrolase family protein n=1 Tax=Salmonella enterica TaxID=28901 RepID=UPI003CED2396